uniref:Tetraspanin-18 n=1 Tax=Magallana gigas TaxID=29159 RepID=K1Q8M1_MAGGI
MKKSIAEFYKGDLSQEPVSLAWNSLLIEFDCCGVDNYMDFMNATHWSKTYNGQTLKTPLSCCKGIEGEFPDIKYPADTTCATNPIDANSNWENGCFYAIKDFINKYSNLFIGIGGGVVINQIYCIIFAIIIYRNVKEGEKIVMWTISPTRHLGYKGMVINDEDGLGGDNNNIKSGSKI